MGNCNMDCCKCIDKKETQFIKISNLSNQSNIYNRNKLNQIRPIEISQIIFIQKDDENKNNENKEKNTIHTLEEEKSKNQKKYNENTNSDTNYKDISFKYSKKLIKDRFYSPNKRYDNVMPDSLRSKTKEKKSNSTIKNNKKKEKKHSDEYNKEEDIVINENISPILSPRFLSTNFKTAKSAYSSYFEKIKDCRKKLEMTDKCKKSQNKISNIFPVKYNQKKKYITFFINNYE